VPVMFSGVVRLLISQSVDGDERAVQDDVRQPSGAVDGGLQVVDECGQEIDGFTQVSQDE
jgi:hypothetical protein